MSKLTDPRIISEINGNLPVYLDTTSSYEPRLIEILLDLSKELASNGTSRNLMKERSDSEAEMYKSQLSYLPSSILYKSVGEVLVDMELEDIAMKQQSAHKLRNVLRSAQVRHEIVQPNTTEDGVTLLGIQPSDLNVTLPMQLLPNIQRLLEQKIKCWYNDLLDYYRMDETKNLFVIVRSKQQALESISLEVNQLVLRRGTFQEQYIESLNKILKLISDTLNMEVELSTYQKKEVEFLKRRSEAIQLRGRLRGELDLVTDMYNSVTKPALEHAHKHVEEQFEKYTYQLLLAQDKLEKYERLGPEFDKVVSEYNTVLKTINAKTKALELFTTENDPK